MGLIFSKIWQKVFANRKIKVIIIGLDSSGKTTILNKTNFGEIKTSLTFYYYYEAIESRKVSIASWDLDGNERARPLHMHFYENTQGIVFVVDSTDRQRIDYAFLELERILNEDLLDKAVLLVFANKQDLREAMTVDEITERLHLHSLQKRIWHVQASCSVNGDGLYEGFEWLSHAIYK